ncbi:adenylyl-sulfate kinase [Microbacterium sp. NPDC076895]|uniref:adenylyl-sulfate kinase n=1 Tax=Microbacterium sp. NPDC076895 TaxID=3154957 RepID=UPI003436D275
MPITTATLTAEQLRDVELALAGAWSGQVSLVLPAGAGECVRLADEEGTVIAQLQVEDAETMPAPVKSGPVIGAGDAPALLTRERISGIVLAERELGHRDRLELRATTDRTRASRTVVITGDVPAADDPGWTGILADTVVTVLDRGDSHALAAAVMGVRSVGRACVVLPAPAERDRNPDEWEDLVIDAARYLIADEVSLWATPRASASGRVILLTGLSGSGKSTIAKLLVQELAQADGRTTTLLDGDEVRLILSAGLGFSRDDRVLNVRRIGWVAALVARHGGIAVCAPIAPYEVMRREMRERAEAAGRFLLVHVSTPLDVCEQRDRKGLYAKARTGEVAQFTGISDPYEVPTDAELVIDASVVSTADAVRQIITRLREIDATPSRP